MTVTDRIKARNKAFAETFSSADLSILPKLPSVILTCIDARVDPAHFLGLELGDAVVARNNGGRVTDAFIEELAALAFMVAGMAQGGDPSFEVILIQHTQCGAERMADPEFQKLIKEKIGIDVSNSAISDHDQSIRDDIERLRQAPAIPGYLSVSGFVYDVKTGLLREVEPLQKLG